MTETEGVKAAVKCEREILGSAEMATRKRLECSNPPTPTDRADIGKAGWSVEEAGQAIADAVRAWAKSSGPGTHDPQLDEQPSPFDPHAH